MTRRVKYLAMAVTAMALAGCAGAAEPPNPFDRGSAAARSIRINVVNNNFNEATLRAVARTERRLGIVPGNGRETFTLAWPTVDDLRIRIDVLAGDDILTNRISVGPGDTVYLTIANPLYRSFLRR